MNLFNCDAKLYNESDNWEQNMNYNKGLSIVNNI